jgi:hypothetical protein
VFSALAYRKLGQDTVARRLLEQCVAVAKSPHVTADDYLRAGMAERYSGNPEVAHREFHLALDADPLFWQARIAEADMSREKVVQTP